MTAKSILMAATLSALALVATPAGAQDYTRSTPGIGGYDPVAYFTDGKPVRGNGYNVSEFEGVTYAFASKAHKALFDANPRKYLPAYGSYCAYGVSVGKKFVADPEVWKIVDGRLYLNLDTGIQKKWNADIPGNIKKADANWPRIEPKAPSAL